MKRREEFITLVQSYMKTKGGDLSGSNSADQLLNTQDFKQILQAFGIKLSPQVSIRPLQNRYFFS